MRVPGLTLAFLLFSTAAVTAQSSGSTEITGFGRYTRSDDALGLQNKVGGGGSLSFFVVRNLALEAEGSYTRTEDGFANPITNIPLRGRLSYHMPLGGAASSIRIGAGYVRNLYRSSVSLDDDGFTGIFGIRLGLTNHIGFRMDGTADYVRNPTAVAGKYVNWGGQAGLSVLMGNSSYSDKDKDGVQDRNDLCGGTPIGKSVDSAGCAASQLDSDRDRVNNEGDGCPNTPVGEAVDAEGCSAGQKDADRDSIKDTMDRCPATPAGERADAEGCSPSQKDEDRDGVANAADRCPASPAGERVNAAGCPAGPLDSDADGVADATDQCPNTPAGDLVNARGCPRDSDSDGIADGRDRCPSTPIGQPIDETGCPILFEKGARSVVLKGVTFRSGKATLTPEARAVLRDIATQLVENPQYRLQISGHTDNVGSRAANLRLSLARARTVETFLEANGVPPTQLTAKGFGPDVPVETNKTGAGRGMNRRVELNRTN
jgi:outer membrane protein OmpA-like peptidoglycan-associated protein